MYSYYHSVCIDNTASQQHNIYSSSSQLGEIYDGAVSLLTKLQSGRLRVRLLGHWIYYSHNVFGQDVALGLSHTATEMINRNIARKGKRIGKRTPLLELI